MLQLCWAFDDESWDQPLCVCNSAGRTLWLVGDSQTWHWYYSVECFLRRYAVDLQRRGVTNNSKLVQVATHRGVMADSALSMAPCTEQLRLKACA